MGRRPDVEKVRYWQKAIREAACSGMSVRAFCRRRRLEVAQFYWWRRRLKHSRQPGTLGRPDAAGPAGFALVSEAPGMTDAGIELVLGNGRRLRIHRGVDEATLRAVLAALEQPAC